MNTMNLNEIYILCEGTKAVRVRREREGLEPGMLMGGIAARAGGVRGDWGLYNYCH